MRRLAHYQPKVCNWTRALRSTRVVTARGEEWLEDAIADDYGPGGPPQAEDPWNRLPGRQSQALPDLLQ